MSKLSTEEAWLWYDAVSSIKLDHHGAAFWTPKCQFFNGWSRAILDAITDGRPLLANFHVSDTFHIGNETKPGAILYNCIFKPNATKPRMRKAISLEQ